MKLYFERPYTICVSRRAWWNFYTVVLKNSPKVISHITVYSEIIFVNNRQTIWSGLISLIFCFRLYFKSSKKICGSFFGKVLTLIKGAQQLGLGSYLMLNNLDHTILCRSDDRGPTQFSTYCY